ncbi:MAG: fibrobacter succinogenes major paralogous domain-containing protein [Fibromonadaceae bacterium]|jgi:uncharacterized protein (TIGR02145 family)|nr:fibrobacter succinogenes major paralogous domain-containing protein [Fibromonadaceae bacterium]
MNKSKFITLAASSLLAMAFIFSCSNESEPLTDSRDGKVYKTVKIGKQIWMAENLNYDGAENKDMVVEALKDHFIPYQEDGSLGKCYNNDPANCKKYGRLYDWAEAMGSSFGGVYAASFHLSKQNLDDTEYKGICPEGWHLPSYLEWDTLYRYIDKDIENKLKAKSGWKNDNGTDDYNFTALPSGIYNCFYKNFGKLVLDCTTQGFNLLGDKGFWWTATEVDASYANNWEIVDLLLLQNKGSKDKATSMSVRCVKDQK